MTVETQYFMIFADWVISWSTQFLIYLPREIILLNITSMNVNMHWY